MKKLILLTLIPSAIFSQVGINNSTPTSTLDITAQASTGATTNVDGMLIPRVNLQRAQLMTAVPTSTLIYVNDISIGTATGIAVDITSTGFYYFDGTKWTAVITSNNNNDWHLTGNTGTNPSNNFIGTSDNQPVVFKINNTNAGTLSSIPFFNTSFGLNTFAYNITGPLNVAFGFQALSANTTGNRNTAIGASALNSNILGNQNTAIGYESLTNSTAGANTGIGYLALRSLTTGSNNIGIGYQAGFDSNAGGTGVGITTGSRNLMLGINTGLPDQTANNQMNIGNIIFGTDVNGTLATPKGNVGIGTSAPTARLEVASGTTGTSGLKFTNINNTTATTQNAAALGVDATGNVVVQNTAPLTTNFKSFSINASSATSSLITIGSLEFRYPTTTCTTTQTYIQVRSTSGANNLGVQHAMFLTAQNTSSFVNTTPITVTPTFADITSLPLNCVQDSHAQFNFFSYTDRTFYRVNVNIADGDSLGFGALGYIFVELQR
ncbi:hypothetical protein [Chryseobacterium limigenitum]|uniref:Head domain of trimeric autotransporter adhesin n=1 Tax=Chryseobacterium limigenitum TaxID=1612149 RepID=A0A1K2IM07_9FLAO|nr:hypothetical protein [Chryseobacterium limigenitum]SFZ93501.1 hypothetical protein SAMN05216324_105105 [Chryseobacterium limigenitum]